MSTASRIPKLNRSLCGCSLETGTKIIGFIELIFNTGMFILSIVLTVSLVEDWPQQQIHALADATPIVLFMELVYLFKTLISVYLLVGVFKDKIEYVKVWVVVQGAFLAVGVMTLFAYLIMLMIGFWNHPLIIIQLVSLGFQVYYILLVYSYYRNRRSESGGIV